MSNQSNDPTVRREKVDPADALDTTETFLPGQIPVKDADDPAKQFARDAEMQDDPVQAEKAVDKPQRTDAEPVEDRKKGD